MGILEMLQQPSIQINGVFILKLTTKIKNKVLFRERTTMMSLLNGLGKAVYPLAEFVSGQLYKVCTKLIMCSGDFSKKNALFNDIINLFASISRLEDIMRFMVCPFCLQFLDSFTFMLSQKVLSREMSFFRMKNKVFSKKLQVLILVVIST